MNQPSRDIKDSPTQAANPRSAGLALLRRAVLLSLLIAVTGYYVISHPRPKKRKPAYDLPWPTSLTTLQPPGSVPVHFLQNLRCSDLPGIRPIQMQLDLYYIDGLRDAPVVVFVHGGGWLGGDKCGIGPKAAVYARNGCLVASINYRLGPMAPAPNACDDIAAAVNFVRTLAASLGGNPDHLVLLGHSAGAHLAALMVADPQYLARYPKLKDSIAGLVLVDGSAYDVPAMMRSPRGTDYVWVFGTKAKLWETLSPAHHAQRRTGLPPTLMVVAGADPVRLKSANALAESLRTGGTFTELLGATLGKDHYSVEGDLANLHEPYAARVLEFIREPHPAAPADARR